MGLDKTLDLFRDGYRFTSLARQRSATPAEPLTVRLLGRKSTIVRGGRGVRLFYDSTVMRRAGAIPAVITRPLFGRGAVHGLDGPAHLHRKGMFVELLMDPRRISELLELADQLLATELEEWVRTGRGVAYDTAVAVYGRAVMRWAGVHEPPDVERRRAFGLAQIVDGFAVPGRPWARAYTQRVVGDRWARRLVEQVRAGERQPPPGSVLARVATERDAAGMLLAPHTAAVELLNVLRPTVAVARLAAFAALELVNEPEWTQRIADEAAARASTVGGPVATAFAHEVRRLAPFVPLLAARTFRPVAYLGDHLPAGRRVLLDVVGTNRNPDAWRDAGVFDPSRFLGTDAEWGDNFVPQGGGRPESGHRCPGELIANGLLALTVSRLATMDLSLAPRQDLGWSWRRMPTMPRSGVVLIDRRRRPDLLG